MRLRQISEKIGFTQLEIKVLLFLLIVFLSGFAVKSFFSGEDKKPKNNFDYSKQDSLFFNTVLQEDSAENPDNGKDKNTDYKRDVLGIKAPVLNSGKVDNLPAEKIIDINKADEKSFTRLPGIGPKTAERIINYRKTKGGFNKLEDLLNVKGIGDSKFSKIKKYLYIEQ